MQPQNSEPIAPISPNPSYDFIYKDPPKPKRGPFKLPNMPKPILLLAGAVIALLLVIIIATVATRGNGNTQAYTQLMSRSQEIIRVSDLVKAQTKNTDTLSLISTAEAALSSEQSSLSSYLATHGTKVNPKDLTLYLDKTSDDKVQTATQNNNLDSTYAKYLKDQLNSYLSQLQSAHKIAGKNAKIILDNAISSTQTILDSPQLSATQ